jgi:general secretion pathway protein A
MYDHFFSFFGLREDPFHVSPDPRFYYPTRAQESALAELLFGIHTRKGFMVLTGEAGTGKTTLLNQLLDWLQRQKRSTAYVFHSLLEPVELLQFILRDFGIPFSSNQKGDLVNALHNWLLARNSARDLPVLIVDEAQALPQRTLDELRLLLNVETPCGKLLQIILSGQPELDEKLRLPTLRQLRQRIIFHSRIPLLTPEETAAYISCRLAAAGRRDSSLFPPDAIQAIYASSRGIPRVVNLLSEHALISAFAERQPVITPKMIQRIAADFDLLAKPLSVTDAEVQPHYTRLASVFPVVDIPTWPPVASQPGIKLAPHPGVSRPAPLEPPQPVAAAPSLNDASATDEFQGIPKFWHRHRSRSDLALFLRNSLAFIQKFRRSVSATVARRRRSLLALRPAVSVAAAQRGVSLANPAPATPPPFVYYVRAVAHSFFRDCRHFFRALTMPSPALELGPSDAPRTEKSAIHRNVLIPVAKWLRQPMSAGTIHHQRRATRSASRK